MRAFKSGRGIYGFKNWFGLCDIYGRGYDSIHGVGVGTQTLDSVSPPQRLKTISLTKLNAYSCLTIPRIGINIAQSEL